jgi:hypothetical protein
MEKLHDFFCGVAFSGATLTQILDCFSVKEFAKNDYFCELTCASSRPLFVHSPQPSEE